MLMSPKAKESILTFCSELCLAVFVLDDGEKEKVSKRIFELHVKKNQSFTMYMYLQYQQIKRHSDDLCSYQRPSCRGWSREMCRNLCNDVHKSPPPKNCISLSKSYHFPSNLTEQLVQMKRYITKWSISRDVQIEIKFYSCLIKLVL